MTYERTRSLFSATPLRSVRSSKLVSVKLGEMDQLEGSSFGGSLGASQPDCPTLSESSGFMAATLPQLVAIDHRRAPVHGERGVVVSKSA